MHNRCDSMGVDSLRAPREHSAAQIFTMLKLCFFTLCVLLWLFAVVPCYRSSLLSLFGHKSTLECLASQEMSWR